MGQQLQSLNRPVATDQSGWFFRITSTPAVAHHPRTYQIDSEVAGGALQHAGPRFTILRGRVFAAGRVTHLDPVERQAAAQLLMDGFDGGLRQRAAPDVRLVGRDHVRESGSLQAGASFRHAGKQHQRVPRGGRMGLAIAHDRRVERSIAVEKNRAARPKIGRLGKWQIGRRL